jgi:hypothetical protein
MRTHRFGQKIKLPATIAIKHQLRKLMFEDSTKRQRLKQGLKQCADNCAKKHDRSRESTFLA